MRDNGRDSKRQRRREHERDPDSAAEEIRRVGVSDDDDADEPEYYADTGIRGERVMLDASFVSAGVTTGTRPSRTAATAR